MSDEETNLMNRDEFVARCEALSGPLAKRALEAEGLRRLPDATLVDAGAADLMRVVVPTSLGGHGLGLEALAQGTRAMARGCPASAWTLSFLMLHGWMLAKLPKAARDEMFGGGIVPLAPAPLAPTGTITPVDADTGEAGYQLSGRWEWATGIAHADWVLVHAVQTEPEFSTKFLVLPIDEVHVDDVWFTSGMAATGSNTVTVTDRFVPAHRTVDARTLMYGEASVDLAGVGDGEGLANLAVPPVLALVASAPALGAAGAAVEAYRQRLSERVLAFTLGDKAAEQPAAQVRLATAISDLASATARWESAIAVLERAAADGRVDEQVRADSRLAAAATVRASRSVISTVCEGAGASVYFSDSPLQRLQRDVEVLKGHVIFDWDRTAELAGRFALGFPLRPTDLV